MYYFACIGGQDRALFYYASNFGYDGNATKQVLQLFSKIIRKAVKIILSLFNKHLFLERHIHVYTFIFNF